MVWAAASCLGSSGGRSIEPVTARVNDHNWASASSRLQSRTESSFPSSNTLPEAKLGVSLLRFFISLDDITRRSS